jgi:hypothetical protein
MTLLEVRPKLFFSGSDLIECQYNSSHYRGRRVEIDAEQNR